jgi:hypothetical protein
VRTMTGTLAIALTAAFDRAMAAERLLRVSRVVFIAKMMLEELIMLATTYRRVRWPSIKLPARPLATRCAR